MAKTYAGINEKIKQGKAVVVTAEEVIGIVEKEGTKKASERIDVVTTGTFGHEVVIKKKLCNNGCAATAYH